MQPKLEASRCPRNLPSQTFGSTSWHSRDERSRADSTSISLFCRQSFCWFDHHSGGECSILAKAARAEESVEAALI